MAGPRCTFDGIPPWRQRAQRSATRSHGQHHMPHACQQQGGDVWQHVQQRAFIPSCPGCWRRSGCLGRLAHAARAAARAAALTAASGAAVAGASSQTRCTCPPCLLLPHCICQGSELCLIRRNKGERGHNVGGTGGFGRRNGLKPDRNARCRCLAARLLRGRQARRAQGLVCVAKDWMAKPPA